MVICALKSVLHITNGKRMPFSVFSCHSKKCSKCTMVYYSIGIHERSILSIRNIASVPKYLCSVTNEKQWLHKAILVGNVLDPQNKKLCSYEILVCLFHNTTFPKVGNQVQLKWDAHQHILCVYKYIQFSESSLSINYDCTLSWYTLLKGKCKLHHS